MGATNFFAASTNHQMQSIVHIANYKVGTFFVPKTRQRFMGMAKGSGNKSAPYPFISMVDGKAFFAGNQSIVVGNVFVGANNSIAQIFANRTDLADLRP